ncbi:amino acid transporter [Actinopolymorpha alba]|uniref:amino acid transporter n=1 Tax=Actinopolymorpha alba TaxID=533267 RepID=UPI000477AE58|nr:amino acid transporter [Actinopolymorpha alba]
MSTPVPEGLAERRSFRTWLLEGLSGPPTQHLGPHAQPAGVVGHSWWKVMCLTGVDYFSTLGYQPGIAVLAAGLLSPIATVILVALTVFGALPVYRRVAKESPHGEGSIAMLERLLSYWKGKLFVLALLGFAATDFMITMTLSAADATAHIVQNPYTPTGFHGHEVAITLALLSLLGAVFLRGFTEAIGVAVVLVATYLSLNLVVVLVALWKVVTAPSLVTAWANLLTVQHGNPALMIAAALLVFPKLALGLSGFETGVAVMPHVKGAPGETEEHPTGRIAGTRKLLTAAAGIMSVFLILSSVVTTLLIPLKDFQPGGPANGRALAYLAHLYLGNVFGSVYDISTIAILWFAGASAMAGLLNLIPRYLPRYGMAPDWARAVRPLVLVLTATAFLLTGIFGASVDAQAGAYATGVLVLITSAAIAVTLAARRAGERHRTVAFAFVSAVLIYTTAANIAQRPEGVKIGAAFVAAILLVSFASRVSRAFELRVTQVQLDEKAQMFVRDCARRTIRLVANEPGPRDLREYSNKIEQIRQDNDLPDASGILFVEVTVRDPSEFESQLDVHGTVMHNRYRVLTMESSTVPNALVALLLHIQDQTGVRPHIYFEWSEGHPILEVLRFLLFGVGEVAPVTREVLRRTETDRAKRPHVHVG